MSADKPWIIKKKKRPKPKLQHKRYILINSFIDDAFTDNRSPHLCTTVTSSHIHHFTKVPEKFVNGLKRDHLSKVEEM